MNRVSLDYRRQEKESKKKGLRTDAEQKVELSRLLEQQWDEVMRALRAHRVNVYNALRLNCRGRLTRLVFDRGWMQITLINHIHRLYSVAHRSPITQVDEQNLAELKVIRLLKENERLTPTLVPETARKELYYREFVSYDDRAQLVVAVLRYANSANRAIDCKV